MKNKKLIKRFNESGRSRDNKGYGGDAIENYFRANVLKMVEQLVEHFKGIEKQMKYLWQSLDELEEKS